MTSQDREKLLRLARMFNVTGKRSVNVPCEVLAGVARTLRDIANQPSREAMRQMWADPSSRHMAAYHHNRRLAG